jgi:hypothetical protein
MSDPYDFSHTITVGALRELLADLPDDMPVILAKDPEGNGFSPLSSFSQAMYEPESTWAGQTYLTPEDLAERMASPDSEWSEEDGAPEGAVRVVELGPVN